MIAYMNIIVFSLLKRADSQNRSWTAACNGVRDTLKTNKEIEELGEGTWLIREGKSLPDIGQLISCAEEENCSYKVVVIHQYLEWDRIFDA